MSNDIYPLHVKPIITKIGMNNPPPERCHVCDGSRYIRDGGGLDISKPGATLALNLCYTCANSLAAVIIAQLGHLDHKQAQLETQKI